MATKKTGPGKVFTKKVTVEKQGDFTPMKNTASMNKKATSTKVTGNVAGRRTSVTTPTGPTRGKVTAPGAKANEKMKKAVNIKISGGAYTVSNKKPSMVDSASRKVTTVTAAPKKKIITKKIMGR